MRPSGRFVYCRTVITAADIPPAPVLLEAVDKTFYDPGQGAIPALRAINLQLDDGVTVLLGANGAGKSTLLRLLAGLLQPDVGSVRICGHDTRTAGTAVRRRLGYLSLSTQCYPRLTGREMLIHTGHFHDLDDSVLAAAVDRVCRDFELDSFLDQRCDGMSTGQRQRINLARTLLPNPPVLVLDEPTTGLDLLAARTMIAAIQAMRRPGRCIVFCTHLLHEAETLADRVAVLHHGHLVFAGPAAELGRRGSFAAAVEELVGAPPPITGDEP